MTFQPDTLAWDKMKGLLPAIIQSTSGKILMLAYMDQTALQQTLNTRLVTFYSRSKQRLWMKGETSGNQLKLIDIFSDCDNDALLIIAEPLGPTCHLGFRSCFNTDIITHTDVLEKLELTITERRSSPSTNSYTTELLNAGRNKICQKVGEECIEVVIAALNETPERIKEEMADLLFHLMVLLNKCEISFSQITKVLHSRLK